MDDRLCSCFLDLSGERDTISRGSAEVLETASQSDDCLCSCFLDLSGERDTISRGSAEVFETASQSDDCLCSCFPDLSGEHDTISRGSAEVLETTSQSLRKRGCRWCIRAFSVTPFSRGSTEVLNDCLVAGW